MKRASMCLAALFGSCAATAAEESSAPQSTRARLDENGVSFRLESTHYYQGLLSGTGSKHWEYGGRLDGYLNLDTAELGMWDGGLVRMHGEYFYGDLPPDLGGVVAPSNVGMRLPNPGTPEDFVLTSLHLVQQLESNRSLIAGVINTVDLIEGHPFFGGGGYMRFQNLAFAAPPNGLLPPVIVGTILSVPTASLGWTFMVFDANDRTHGGWFDDLFEDMNFSVSAKRSFEAGGRASALTMTGIYGTQNGANLSEVLLPADLQTGEKSHSWHASVQFDHVLRESPERPGNGFGFYVKAGVSDGNPNPYQSFITGGIGGKGLFAGRPNDVFGIGYFYYNLSDDLQSALDPALVIDDEQGIELFYDIPVTSWLRVAADLQYADPAIGANEKALSAGVRARITF